MKIPEQPDFLTEPARNAFFRIYHFLESQGLWDDIYSSLLAVTAVTCDRYLSMAKCGLLPSEAEEERIAARKLLADFYYIPENRIYLAVITQDGIDADIAALCEPFKTHQDHV